MAITDTQKLDALYKKFGFGVSKTDTATNKSPSNEAIPSPLLVRGDKVWNESDLIPLSPPASTTAQVQVRRTTDRVAATVDGTATPNRTWITGVKDWIPPQFGATYSVKVYADTVGALNPESTGTLLAPDGSNNDAYLFDYTSGVLNFIDTNLPAALSGKSIFVVGYTYKGSVGLKNSSNLGGGLASTDGSISTTVTNGNLTLSGNGTGIVVIDDSATINQNLIVNGTSDLKGATTIGTVAANTTLTVNGNIVATGNETIGGNLVVTGDLTVKGAQTIVETEILKVADNIITLNNGIGNVAPTENAGLEIDRGTEGTLTLIQWNETTDKVEINQGGALVTVASINDVNAAKTALETEIGSLASLTTDEKTTIVGAINEVDAHANNIYTTLGVTADATQSGFDGLNYVVSNSTFKAAVVALDTQLRTTTNQVDGKIGTLTDLTTASKTTLVAALNEVDSHTNNLYSSLGSFSTQDANALVITGTNYLDSATTVSLALSALDTQLKTTTSQVDGKIGDFATLTTTAQGTLVAAVNEVDLHTNSIYTVLGVTADATQSGLNGLNYVSNNATLTSAITSLDSQLKTTTQQVDGVIGNLNDLTTTAKNTLVAAINEVDLHANKLYTTLGSFSTQDSNALVITGTNYLDSATTVSLALAALDTQLKTTTSQVDGNIGVLSTLTTGSKGTLVGAINEVDAHANNLYSVVGTFATQDSNALVITGTNYLDSATTISGALTSLDTVLKTRVNALNTATGLTNDNYVADNTTNYIKTASSLFNADKLLDTALFNLETVVGPLSELAVAYDANHPSMNTISVIQALNSTYYYAYNLQDILGSAVYIGEGVGLQFAGTTYINTAVGAVTTVTDTLKLLDTELNRVETGIGAWGSLTTTAKTVVTAINELDTDLASEVTRATGVEGNLASLTTASKANLVAAINSEVARASNAESGVTTRLNNINTAAGIASDTYTADAASNYLTSATTLFNADQLLDAKLKSTIVDLASTTAGKGTGLVGYKGYTETDVQIVSPTVEIAAGTVQAALDDIAASVNLKIHELESRYVKAEVAASEKSDVYTLVHNLDTSFVDVSVQVYDDVEHVWRFDLVVVEVVDDNTVTVSLAAGIAQQIRYVIHGY